MCAKTQRHLCTCSNTVAVGRIGLVKKIAKKKFTVAISRTSENEIFLRNSAQKEIFKRFIVDIWFLFKL